MSDHYNAFISYKHAEADIKVAEAIEKGLERFHIPGKIRKKTGYKRIQRIFRDKDELTLTSDLTSNIIDALNNADYLIVICSTNTRSSEWVTREIQYFLRTHTRQQILTVLVDGEPQDTIPEILLSEERKMIDENGIERIVNVPLEPLSCDYRMPMHKAKKEELPRLASVIIGCSYDELMNRRRQYKIRRLSLIFSAISLVLLVFSLYILRSKKQINENYRNSLKNQSKYLANEAERLLEHEQRITALKLCIEALPKKKFDRPVTPEAVRALTDATLSYRPLLGSNIESVWNYTMPSRVTNFFVSDDGEYLVGTDNTNNIIVWESTNHEVKLHLNDSTALTQSLLFYDNNKLISWTNNEFSLYDLETGDKIWTYESKDPLASTKPQIMKNGNIMLFTNSSYIIIDQTNGKEIKSGELPKNDTDYVSNNLMLSPDESKLSYYYFKSYDEICYGIYDLKTKKTNILGSTPMLPTTTWNSDNNLVVAIPLDDSYSTSYGEKAYIKDDHKKIVCIDSKSLKTLWEQEFVCSQVEYENSFLELPSKNALLYYCGNVAAAYDNKTGEILFSNNVNDSIVTAMDNDGDGNPTYITNTGKICFANLDSHNNPTSVTTLKVFTDNINKAEVKKYYYIQQAESNDIIAYDSYISDNDWTPMETDVTVNHTSVRSFLNDNIFATVSQENDTPVLNIFNPNDNTHLKSIQLSGDYMLNYEILCVYENKLYLSYVEHNKIILISVDLSTFETNETTVSEDPFSLLSTMAYNEYRIIYLSREEPPAELKYSGSIFYINLYDIRNGETSKVPFSETTDHYPSGLYGFLNNNFIYSCGSEDSDFIVHINSKKVTPFYLPANWHGTEHVANGCGKIAISDNETIIIMDENAEEISTISCPNVVPLSMTFYKNNDEINLLVVYNDSSLCRYDCNGKFIGKTIITVPYYTTANVEFKFEKMNGLLYLRVDDTLCIVDINNWFELAYIPYCHGHHIPTDHFITFSYAKTFKESSIGYFKHYTVDDLIDKGKYILQGTELTEEEKSYYGISSEP